MTAVRMVRIVGSLSAAIIIAPLIILGYCVSEADRTDRWAAVLVLLAASAVLWIGGLAVTALINRHRRQAVRLWQCLVLGATSGFATPIFGILLAQSVAPWFAERTGKSAEFPLDASLLGGLFILPTALLSGWILWRGSFPAAGNDQGNPTARRSSDLHGMPLVFALAVMAVLPAVMFFIGCLAFLINSRPENLSVEAAVSPRLALILGGWIFCAAIAWSVLGGFVLLHAFTRRRGLVDRMTCLAVGTCVAMLLPFAVILIGLAVGRVIEPILGAVMLFASGPPVQGAALYAMVGGLLLPLGVPGGWVLWHVSVRPAPLPISSNTETIFD